MIFKKNPPTPYIFDDRCEAEDAAARILEVYNMSDEERTERGLAGREWALSDEAGFTSKHQANRVIDAFNELFSTWVPRDKFELIDANNSPKRTLKHKLIYKYIAQFFFTFKLKSYFFWYRH